VSDKLTLDLGGDQRQPLRIVSAFVAGICATRLRPSIVTSQGFAERLVGDGNPIGCES